MTKKADTDFWKKRTENLRRIIKVGKKLTEDKPND